jgi:hypothetical protein
MRKVKYGTAIFAAVVVGFGVKFYVFSPPVAEANIAPMEITAMQMALTAMHRQQLKDMTFVFVDSE